MDWFSPDPPTKLLPAMVSTEFTPGIDLISAAAALHAAIVAGSVADGRADGIWNTAYIFDRSGACVASHTVNASSASS